MTDELKQAITAIQNGDRATGKKLLTQILYSDPNNENAWLWMSQIAKTEYDRRYCLQKILEINPDNKYAKQGLAILQKSQANQPEPSHPPQSVLQELPNIESPPPPSAKPLKKLKPIDSQTTKKCPYCAETIKAEAVICRFCGKDLAKQSQPQRLSPVKAGPPPQKKTNPLVIILIIAVVACCGIPVVLSQVNDSMRQVGLLPTLTPRPTPGPTSTPTKTPIPTATVNPEISKARWGNVDIRDLSKNPDGYIGREVNYRGEVFTIEENREGTAMQVWVDIPGGNEFDREAVIVFFEGRSDGIYEGTEVEFWGYCTGTMEGTNAFGGTIRQPSILAEHLTYFH